jgi:translation initiation factor IF-3
LADGDKVKISATFRGRELKYIDDGKKLLNRMTALLRDVAVIEREAKLEGRNMILIVTPKPSSK